jgi:hypothetical protein
MSSNELVLLRRIEELEKLVYRQPEIGGVWKDWTPTWTASTTNPSIGNGTLLGRYSVVGKIVICKIFLQFGSTTTAGSGAYSFTYPVTPKNYRFVGGTYRLRKNGGSLYNGGVEPFASTFALIRDGGTYVTNATPFGFTNLDIIGISLSYEIA